MSDQQKRQLGDQGRPYANSKLTKGRIENRYEAGFPIAWLYEDILGNLRQLNREVDELRAEIAALKGKGEDD